MHWFGLLVDGAHNYDRLDFNYCRWIYFLVEGGRWGLGISADWWWTARIPLAASSAQREGLRICSQPIFSILLNSIEEFRTVMNEVDRWQSSKSVRSWMQADSEWVTRVLVYSYNITKTNSDAKNNRWMCWIKPVRWQNTKWHVVWIEKSQYTAKILIATQCKLEIHIKIFANRPFTTRGNSNKRWW